MFVPGVVVGEVGQGRRGLISTLFLLRVFRFLLPKAAAELLLLLLPPLPPLLLYSTASAASPVDCFLFRARRVF